MKRTIISLGMRCNSADIIRYRMEFNQPAFVFDSVQFAEKTMLDIINLNRDQVQDYFDIFFSNPFTEDKKHPITGDWIPHHITDPNELQPVKERYVRRAKRFLDYLTLGTQKTFLMTMSFKPAIENELIFEHLRESVCKKMNDDYLFLTLNCGLIDKDEPKHKNLTIDVSTWEDFDNRAIEWLTPIINN